MASKKINFYPPKKFFIDTLVKDVQLIDSILDLIDNSIDGYIKNGFAERKNISIIFSADSFTIEDNCGGIKKEDLYDHVFKFGDSTKETGKTIGVFGIGLKRSIFKMGRCIVVETDDGSDYVSIVIDDAWIDDDDNWELEFSEEKISTGNRFTRITVSELFPNIVDEFTNGVYFQNQLLKRIKETYSIFLEEKLDVKINGISAEHYDFKFLYEKDFAPFHKVMTYDNVEAEVYAGFSSLDSDGLYGWYIFCNDRMVIGNDTTAKTGWGDRKYHYPEDNRFLGLVFFRSNDPLSLPWHTTKEDIQEDSKVYRSVQVEMKRLTILMTDVIRLAGRTKDPVTNETIGKSLFENVAFKYRKEISEELDAKIPPVKGDQIDLTRRPTTTSIQYSVPISLIKTVKEKLGDPYMSNGEVGKNTFYYYVRMEEVEQ